MMAGNVKFEASSVSPDDSGFTGGYLNGQRSSYSGPSLDRSGSFREGSESRSFSSGAGNSKSNSLAAQDLPPLSQCLVLDPITMGDSKYTRAGEVRRALGVLTFGNVVEDNSFAASQSRPPPTFSPDELKRFRATVQEGLLKARNRAKRLDEYVNKLNKYQEAINSKKLQAKDRSGGSSLLKMGAQSHRSLQDFASQKLEERNKNVLNKRARTPMGDIRAEGRSNGVPRQHLVLGKDKDGAKEGGSDLGDEKIRRLPAGGEGWDKKMKRKRSVSNVGPRSLDGEGEPKRTIHSRLVNDSSPHSAEAHGFRLGSSSIANGSNKLDGSPSSSSLSGRMIPKNDMVKASLSRELTGMSKERLLPKGNTKLNMREDPNSFHPSSITKCKSSRTHRGGSVSVGNSSPSFSRMSGNPEDWEQALNVNKVHSLAGVNNRKRPLPSDSSSPPMAQWVGQRPQKISRSRRTNVVSPTSNHDEAQVSAEGCSPSDFSTRISSGENGSFPVRNIMSSSQQLKAKLESVQSPARLSESEENSAENRPKDKALGGLEVDEKSTNGHQQACPSGLFTKKSKLHAKDEIGDGVRRQGRSGRGSSFSKGSASPLREKLENPVAGKPFRNTRPGSEKNGSKSGRPPLKKHSERKGFTRLGPVQNSSSPDFTGESDDDHEELKEAAQFACNASYNGCSSPFWKRMESLFYVEVADKSFLQEQLKGTDKHHSNQSQVLVLGDRMMHDVSQAEEPRSQSFNSGDGKICIPDNELTVSSKTGDLATQIQDHDSSYRGDFEKGPNNLTPLYQRVLSALIVEDESEEYENNYFLNTAASLTTGDDPCKADRISCNGNVSHSRFSGIQVSFHEEIEEGVYACAHPSDLPGPEAYQNEVNVSLSTIVDASGFSSLECEYDQMCLDDKVLLELQSFGLYPDTVPDLAEGEDELISEDVAELKKQLLQQVDCLTLSLPHSSHAEKKKAYLERIHRAMEERKEVEGRDLEQVAMNRLTEVAYRKLLATRGNYAVRIGISKVPRHVALSFLKRTLTRCRKFEEAGKSCFSEPALRDVLFAVPERNLQLEARATGAYPGCSEQLDLQNDKFERSPLDAYGSVSHHSDQAFAKNGPILNRGKKKEVLLDDVGGNSAMRSTSTLGSTMMGGAKGKRSDRDSGAKAGRPSVSNLRGERKTKSKPKQKAGQLSMHPVQPSASSELVADSSNRKRGLVAPGNILDSSKENNDAMDLSRLPLSEIDSIEDLNVANEFEGHQDLSTWLNFDEVEGLQEDDGIGGLQIPMDDLSELNMLL